jgi:hypothetical protein
MRRTMLKSVRSSDIPLEIFSEVVEAIYDCALGRGLINAQP